MNGQIKLIDYLEKNYENLLSAFAKGLIDYCNRWNYDKIDRLLQNVSIENFIRIFCNITCTFFFEYEKDFYGAFISKKDKIVKIYKCGKNHEKIVCECSVQEVINKLMHEYTSKKHTK